jgi:hypothetical protein
MTLSLTPGTAPKRYFAFGRLAVIALVAASLLGGLVASSAAAGKPGVVKTKNGLEIMGDVDESAAETVTIIKADGKPTLVYKANVGSIKYFDSVKEEFDYRLKGLGRQDVPGHIALARWAIAKKEPALAAQAVASAKAIDPASTEVAALEKQLNIAKPPATKPVAPPPATAPVTTGGGVGPAKRLLTPEEITLVRLREMPRGDKTIKLQVLPTAKIAARDAGVINDVEFKSITLPELAMRILDSNNAPPALKQQVKVLSDPAPLVEYRQKVNKVLVASCASAACHGGNQGGNLLLFPDPQKEDQVLTNFVVLQKFEKKVEGAVRSMLDRNNPEASLLLGYMLNPETSRTPHPKVEGFKAAARTVREPAYVAAMNWMGKSLIPIAAPYGDIDLTAPAPKPAAPAKAAAAAVGAK